MCTVNYWENSTEDQYDTIDVPERERERERERGGERDRDNYGDGILWL